MIGIDALMQAQQRYLEGGKENWSYASEQAALLSRLSLHHGQVIARQQADAVRMTIAGLQELAPKFLVPNIADAFAAYANDFGQRWLLFWKRCASAATNVSCASRKASSRCCGSTTT